MSQTYSIGCKDCQVHLWIGQRRHIYRGDVYIEALEKFLYKHRNHSLIFGDNCENELSEWKELEPEDINKDEEYL